MFKVNKGNTRTRCEICLKLTVKTPWRRFGVFIANFEHISQLVLVLLLLTLSRQMTAGLLIKSWKMNLTVGNGTTHKKQYIQTQSYTV